MAVPGLVRRWAGTVAVAVLVAAVCTAAGAWQWYRHTERSAAIAVVEANYGAAPVPLGEALGAGARLDPADVWRPARVRGEYLDAVVLLRNRPVGGQAGFHVLTPLRVVDGPLAGSVLVVDRGWVPTGADSSEAASVPVTPDGVVDVVVRLRADEAPSDRGAPPGQVQAIHAAQVRDATGAAWPAEATLPLYGAAVTEDGAAPDGLGRLERPSTDPGSHLSYAFQWWVFAVGALVGCGWLIAREERSARAGADDGAPPTAAPSTIPPAAGTAGPRGTDAPRLAAKRPTPRRRRPTAEEEEDAILDGRPLP